MKERFRAADYRFILICLLILGGTVWYAAGNFFRAFPEASIDFRVSREEASQAAARFLKGHAYRTEGYREASSFTFDDRAKTFLEREAGLAEANRLMSTRIRMWRWSYRWFRPLQKEEFRADVTPSGEVVGFEHEIAEDAARPAVTAEQARGLAENFLREKMHRDPAALDFVESSENTRPHRVDREFTWKERDFNLYDATYRISVTVLGNEVGDYREYLKVPDQWTRDYERLRSKNEFAQTIDTAVTLVLMLGMIIVIVMRVRRQDIRWRRAALIGAIGMALAFCASLNEFPLREFGYPTTDSYNSFVTTELMQAVLLALGAGGLLFVLAAGAEPLYREAFRDKISVGNLFRPRGMRTRKFFLGTLLGITLAGIFVAYQTAFYIVAYRYGAWSPADVPYTDLLNTRLPWAAVLFGGYLPAVSEEFLFRMFAIPFLRKLVRWLPLAVVLAAFTWGFGHAGYPQQPFYIRGMEVGIGGVALGLVMLRWGILPTLVWHYSVDAMYTAMLFVRSHNLYFKFSGAASAGVMVLPLVVALAAYFVRGGFEAETGLLNGDEGTAPEAPPEPKAEAEPARNGYRPLSARRRVAGVGILAVGLLALLIPGKRFGESPKYKLTADDARARADAFLKAQNFDPAAFRHVTFPDAHWSGDDRTAGKYFLERRPVAASSDLFERYQPLRIWNTRYFKSLDKEEVTVAVHPETGKILGFNHEVPEDRPGADLPSDRAQQIASEFAASRGFDLGTMELKQSDSEKKKARRDYTLVWEARAGDPRNVDEAHYRLSVEVSGDRVTNFHNYWKIPEAFVRLRSQQNWISISTIAAEIAGLVALIVCGIFFLVQVIRKGMVRWRVVLWSAVGGAALAGTGAALSAKLMLQNYNTAIPLETFQAAAYIGLGMVVLVAALMFASSTALVTSFNADALGALRRANRRILGLDAGVALLAAIGLGLLLTQIDIALADRFHAQALYSVGAPVLIASAAPAVSALAGAPQSAIGIAAALCVLVLILEWVWKRARWMVAPLAIVAPLALCSSEAGDPGELALQYAGAVLMIGCVAVLCFCFARRNYLAYGLVIWMMALRAPIATLLGNPNTGLQAQGWILAGVLALSVIWAVAPGFGKKPEAARATVGD